MPKRSPDPLPKQDGKKSRTTSAVSNTHTISSVALQPKIISHLKIDQNMADMIHAVQKDLQEEVDRYNKTKTDTKKSYSKIQQLRGALDVLLSLAENYHVVRKTQT